VRLDSVIYFPIEEPSAELSRFRSGELDITETIPTGRFEWLRENLPRALRIHPYLGSFWLGFNLRKPHLADTALRKALALAIDRETLVRVVLGSGEVPAWGIVPPGLDGYPGGAPDYAGLAKEARIEAAREYLAASVYDPAEPLVLEIRYNTSSLHRRVMVAVAAMWKQSLGISAELVNEEWKVFVNNRRLGVVTEVFRGGWIADFADPTTFLDLFHGGSQLNTTFYANPEYDRLLRDASTMRGAARMEALAAAEARLMDDMPVIPLYYYVSRHLVSERTQGFIDNVRDIHLSRYLDVEPLRDGG
jgi:ABC-type oligopeptide transport system substrate-binding subunit